MGNDMISVSILNEDAVVARKKKIPEELKGHRKADDSFEMTTCGVSGTHNVSIYVLQETDDIILFSNCMFEKDIGMSVDEIEILRGELRRQGYDDVTVERKCREDYQSLDTVRWVEGLKFNRKDARYKPKFAYTDSWVPVVQKRPCYIKIHGMFRAHEEAKLEAQDRAWRGRGIVMWRDDLAVELYRHITRLSWRHPFFYRLTEWPEMDYESAEYERLCEKVVDVVSGKMKERGNK